MQSQIIITPKGKLMGMVPHYLLINDQMLGIVKGREVRINIPSGRYKITVRSMYKFIEGSADVYVPINETKQLTFSDRDRIWNWLFNVDLILWILKRIIHVPEPWGTIYEIVSNGFFAIWLLRIWIDSYNPFADKIISSELRRRIVKAMYTGWDNRYGFYLDDGWEYVYRSFCLLNRFQLAELNDGTYRIVHYQKSDTAKN